MQLIALLLISFCIYSCKETVREQEDWFELSKPEAGSLNDSSFHHLGGGLCVGKYEDYDSHREKAYEWIIKIRSCYDSLPTDTTPTENIMKYKQGGLCFYHDCSIKPDESFTIIFMNVPNNFIGSNEYDISSIFASKYSDSTMLYRHIKRWRPPEYKVPEIKAKKIGDNSILFEEIDIKPKREVDTIIFLNKHNEFWKELFSIAKSLKIQNELFSGKCNSKFCSTKDILNPLYKISCNYRMESKFFECYPGDSYIPEVLWNTRIKPKCFDKLERLSSEHGLLMHSGAFPAGDCDLGNWRYIKIDSLSGERREKLKSLLKPPDSISVYEQGS